MYSLRDSLRVQTVHPTLFLSYSFVEKRTHTGRFNVRCPSKTDVLSGPKFQTSICPTYRVTDVDVNRIPHAIVQRRCKCTDCLSVLDSTLGSRAFSRCVPTFQYQMVLRRVGCVGGVFEYKPVMEPFVVGCSCKLFFDQWINKCIQNYCIPDSGRFISYVCAFLPVYLTIKYLFFVHILLLFYFYICISDKKRQIRNEYDNIYWTKNWIQ